MNNDQKLGLAIVSVMFIILLITIVMKPAESMLAALILIWYFSNM